jgi:hypothetical protein
MKKTDIVNKNLELHYHLMMQLLREPDSLDLPEEAEIVFLPEDDETLREANVMLGKRREKTGARVVYVSVRLVPETRTVLRPELAVVSGA